MTTKLFPLLQSYFILLILLVSKFKCNNYGNLYKAMIIWQGIIRHSEYASDAKEEITLNFRVARSFEIEICDFKKLSNS